MSDDKKSWRDVDRGRDKSAHRDHRGPSRGGPAQRVESATAAYKRKLSKFFDEGVVPEHLKEQLGGDEPPSERQTLIRAIRQSESGRPLVKAVDAFLASYEMFDDMELLLRVLEHPKDPVLLQAIERIEAHVESGQAVPRKDLYRRRLEGLEFSSFDPRVQRRAQALAAKLKSFPTNS